MSLLRLSYFIPIWLFFLFCIRTPLIILGWLLVPLNFKLGKITSRKSQVNDKQITAWSCPFMWLWGNEEDGLMYPGEKCTFKNVFYWSAVRNPANNLRYVPHLSAKLDRHKIKWVGGPWEDPAQYDRTPYSPEWWIAWQGIYSCVLIRFKLFGGLWKFWIGWKLRPTDTLGVSQYRKAGAGFATQFKRIG